MAAAIRQRASQHLQTSLDQTLWRFVRRDRTSSSRTCEVQILWVLARYAQASSAFGISGSGVAELRVVELRRGNRSLHTTFRPRRERRALSHREMPKWGGDGTSMRPQVRGEVINIAHLPKFKIERWNAACGPPPLHCYTIVVAGSGAKTYKANVKV